MSSSDYPGTLILKRHFIRKAMELEVELDITPQELALLWAAHKQLGISKIQMPGESRASDADLEINGVPSKTDWSEPAAEWMEAKQAAVRKVLACLVNDAQNLPQIGRRVDRIVRQTGTADIYFDDGSFVSATVSDPQPRTSDEAAVIESVYGVPTKAKSCGCKKASCVHVANPVINMVGAVRRNELLGAMDVRKRGAKDGRFWSYKIDGPFELYLLEDVPLDLARALTDFPTRTTRLRNGRHAWTVAQQHAVGRPFKRVTR